jgi:branched-chain amino acid transport system permease protein
VTTDYAVSTLLQYLIQGTVMGAIYGLVALGFSLQYSAMRLVNFAHGESFMLGAVIASSLTATGAMTLLPAFCVTVLVMGAFGAAMERFLIRPLYGSPPLNIFIATIGISVVLRQLALLYFGADAKPFPNGFGTHMLPFGPARISLQQIGTLVAAIILMAALQLTLRRTRLGTAMRAVAQDETTAALMGIDTLRVKSMAFALSTALGAASGILFGSLTFVVFDMGLLIGIKGFAAAVLGGLGSMPGAILGGFLVGLIEQLAGGYISSLYRDAISLSVLVVVMLVLPRGLVGRRGSVWGKV